MVFTSRTASAMSAPRTQPDGAPGSCPVCDGACRPFTVCKGTALYECSTCRLIFMWQLPGIAALDALYQDAYQGATTSYFAKAEKKRRRAKRIARRLARLKPPPGRFLDVGCSGGFLADAMRAQGFTARGIDADRPGIAYAQKQFPANTYYVGYGEDLPVEAGRFDVVSCIEVIEHAPAPRRLIKRIAEAMEPGALLYLTTPDIRHWRRPHDLGSWDAFCPPAHCLYFSKESLGRLLGDVGLKIERYRIALKPGLQLYARKNGRD